VASSGNQPSGFRRRGHVQKVACPAGDCPSAGGAELAGELLAQGGDLRAEPGDLVPVGVQLLPKRVDGGLLAGGFPVLSVLPGQFLLKDLVLLGASLWTLGDSLAATKSRTKSAVPRQRDSER